MCAKWQNVCTEMAQAHYKVQAQVKPLPLLPLSVAMWEKKKKTKQPDCSCKNTKQGSFHSSVKKNQNTTVCCHPTLHLDSKRAPDSHLTMIIMEQLKGHLFCNLTHV